MAYCRCALQGLLRCHQHLDVLLQLRWVARVAHPQGRVPQLTMRVLTVVPVHLLVSVKLISGGCAFLLGRFGLLFSHIDYLASKAHHSTGCCCLHY